jgi:hypothetical protein
MMQPERDGKCFPLVAQRSAGEAGRKRRQSSAGTACLIWPCRAGQQNLPDPAFLLSGARRHLWATWVRLVFPPRRTVRDNLDGDSFRLRNCLINHVVYVSAA